MSTTQGQSITIKANDEVRQLAQTAVDIQDACNGVAVANFLIRVQQHFRQDRDQSSWGGYMGDQNPVSRLVANKLADLCRLNCGLCFDEYMACVELAAGRDVEWTIDAA